jgi:hypothetical protein
LIFFIYIESILLSDHYAWLAEPVLGSLDAVKLFATGVSAQVQLGEFTALPQTP